jgi:autotransporter-associated beta strand protein
VSAAHALDGTWLGTTDGDWSTGTNWSSTPTVPDGTANFNCAAPTTIGNSAGVTIDTIAFSVAASTYTFNLANSFTIIGTGITGNAQTFNGSIDFQNASTAGNALINGGAVFENDSTAGNATIIVANTFDLTFLGSAKAGTATITNNSSNPFGFNGSSSADHAHITNNIDKDLEFQDTSTAGSATIINYGSINFRGQGSPGNAATAANADITNNGVVFFNDYSTAATASITTTTDATTFFFESSSGAQARFITDAGGIVDFSRSTGPNNDGFNSAGSFAGAGNYYLGANQLTIGGNNLSTEVSGVISDCGATGTECSASGAAGGSLFKTGAGTLTLDGVNTYSGDTNVTGGKLVVNGPSRPLRSK